MRKNRATNFFIPALFAQPRDANERMTLGRTMFQIRMPLVIHIVEQTNRFPKIGIFSRPAKRGEVSHRISSRVAMFPQPSDWTHSCRTLIAREASVSLIIY